MRSCATIFPPPASDGRRNRLRPIARIILAVNLVTLSSCALISRQPGPPYSDLAVVAISSRAVDVLPPRFLQIHHRVFLDGSVRRVFGTATTSHSTLQIVYRNSIGEVLLTQFARFHPAELPPRSSHPFNEGLYRLSIGELPVGTSRIEVKAVDKPVAGRHLP